MSKPKQRSKITVVAADAEDEQTILRAGGVTIDLRKVQATIDDRKRDELSWSHLMKAIDGGTCVYGQHTGSGALQRVLRKQLVERLGRALNASELAKLNDYQYPSPVDGFAATISDHFNLAEVAPQFNAVLLQTERKSLEKGKEIESVDKDADIEGLSHEAAVLAARATDELNMGAPAHTIVVGNEHTYVGGGTGPHREAHAAARDIQPGTNLWAGGGQFTSVMALAAAARRDKGWRERAAAEAKTSQGASLEH